MKPGILTAIGGVFRAGVGVWRAIRRDILRYEELHRGLARVVDMETLEEIDTVIESKATRHRRVYRYAVRAQLIEDVYWQVYAGMPWYEIREQIEEEAIKI